jgi:hypothetical protein
VFTSTLNATVMAFASSLVGVTLNLSSNIPLTMLSLSQRYAAATSAAQSDLLTARQAVLTGNDPLAATPGTGTRADDDALATHPPLTT